VTWDWQQLVALLCVAVALFVLGRRGWRLWKGRAQPGGACATCPVHEGSTAPQAKPLVTLDLGLAACDNDLAAAKRSTDDGANPKRERSPV
jgi:hypothetical protein